ncbi:MAG: UbiA family prenyltransferase [Bacteroidia bacterium]|nr:UbiA family prenyltransferase [Bacteroidia bacterium]
MIVLSQVLIRYCIILPAFETESIITGDFPVHLSLLDFSLLVFSTIIIAAGGYIINDAFDIDTDAINKPGKNVVGTFISETTAKKLFLGFSFIGICIGFYLSWKIDKLMMGCVQIFTAVSLWMYATYYKKRFLSGNLLIALLTSLSLLVVGLFEPEFYRNFIYLLLYSGFAFSLTLLREIIKDIEDVEGDERTHCKTLPVRLGIPASKRVVYGIIILNILLILYTLYQYFYSNLIFNFWIMASMFTIPLLALFGLVRMAEEMKDYYYAGMFTKIIMLAGILTMIPFYYYFLR